MFAFPPVKRLAVYETDGFRSATDLSGTFPFISVCISGKHNKAPVASHSQFELHHTTR